MKGSLVDLPPEALAMVALHLGMLHLDVCKRVLTLRGHIGDLALDKDWFFVHYVGDNRSLVMKAEPVCLLLWYVPFGMCPLVCALWYVPLLVCASLAVPTSCMSISQ